MQAKLNYDLWDNNYDKVVGLSHVEDHYPYAGHKLILNKIYNYVLDHKAKKVLDIGFGSAILSYKLYSKGIEIYGQELSARNLIIAQNKMPKAKLYKGDFAVALNNELKQEKYDAIIATYILHHLDDKDKISFIKELLTLLNPGGSIYIGDIAFKTEKELEACKSVYQNVWDYKEIYIVYENLAQEIRNMRFEKISECSGIIVINK